jgi:hypothetical protein
MWSADGHVLHDLSEDELDLAAVGRIGVVPELLGCKQPG